VGKGGFGDGFSRRKGLRVGGYGGGGIRGVHAGKNHGFVEVSGDCNWVWGLVAGVLGLRRILEKRATAKQTEAELGLYFEQTNVGDGLGGNAYGRSCRCGSRRITIRVGE